MRQRSPAPVFLSLVVAILLVSSPASAQDDDWLCDVTYWGDGACDCGCGEIDVDCEWGGCADPGCSDAECAYCDGAACDPLDDGEADGWTCDPAYRDDGACDCGCGEIDPDCGGGGCEWLGCRDAACQYCDDGEGLLECTETAEEDPEDAGEQGAQTEGEEGIEPDGSLAGWSCNTSYYGDGECDCGCGLVDVDCGGGGCAEPGCWDGACQYCGDESGLSTCDAGAAADASCGFEYGPCCGDAAGGGCGSGLDCNGLFEEPLCTVPPLEEPPAEVDLAEWPE